MQMNIEWKIPMNSFKVPRIRFKGFDVVWVENRIADIVKISAGGDVDKIKLKETGQYPVVANSLTNRGIVGFYDDYKVKAPAVTVTGRGDVGYAVARHENFTPIVRLLTLQSENIDVDYLENQINSMRILNESTGVPQLTAPQLGNYKVYHPEINEQTAIGSLFRNLDDLLASYKDNLANYQSLKATMLAKMFPKAGQTIPEMRLDRFEGEWEIKKFKSISTKRGKSNSKGYDYPAYSVSNQSGLIPQSEQFEGSRLENLEKTSYKIVEPNEFAYNPARINVGSIAFNDLDETVIVSSLYVIFSLDKSINNNYALLFIKSPEFNKEVRRNTEGSVREYLFYENFANIRIPIPPSLEEQQAIGAYFSNLDNLINSYQEKISQLETLKNKLLQDMFI
ncbi:restriction endonuclease subunit S [Streptococcus sp. C150]|uniref:restriction endonuclease subunit S n=1 Tax=Streptococcus sp. C150 TaxID=435842 RepID=UPI0001F88A43|nr:type I restriction modification DNA specificity domain protein [Streptococcus sp. C150]